MDSPFDLSAAHQIPSTQSAGRHCSFSITKPNMQQPLDSYNKPQDRAAFRRYLAMDSASLLNFSNTSSVTAPSQHQGSQEHSYAPTSSFEPVGTQSTSDHMTPTYPSPTLTSATSQIPYPTLYEHTTSLHSPPQQHVREQVVTRVVPALFGFPVPGGAVFYLTGTVSGVSAVEGSIASGLCVLTNDAPNASTAFFNSLSYFHQKNWLPSEAQMQDLLNLPTEQQLAAGYDASRDHTIDPSLSVQQMPGVHISSQGAKQLDHCLAYLRIAARYQDHGRVFAIALISKYLNGNHKVDHLPTVVGVAPTHTLCMYRTITAHPNKSLTESWRAMVLPPDASKPQPEPTPPLRITKEVASLLAQQVQTGEVDFGEDLNGMLLAGILDSIPRHLLANHPRAQSQQPKSTPHTSHAPSTTTTTTTPNWTSLDPYSNLPPSSLLFGPTSLPSPQITGPTILRLALTYTNAELYTHILRIAQSEGGTIGSNSITKRITNALKSYITQNLGVKGRAEIERVYGEVRGAFNEEREKSLKAVGKQVHMGARNQGGRKRGREEDFFLHPAKRLRTRGKRQGKSEAMEEEEEEVEMEEVDDVLTEDDAEEEEDVSSSFLQTPRRSTRSTRRQIQSPAQTEVEVGAEEDGEDEGDEDEMDIDDDSDVSDWAGE